MKLKIILIGPKQSGKSSIANFLFGQSQTLVCEKYDPTVGVRILEGDFKGANNQPVNVELWDSSGDSRYTLLIVFNKKILF